MKLIRRKKLKPTIPLSSMADIAFLLLIFFIVTSAMKFQEESTVIIPKVKKLEKIEQKERQDIWINKNGTMFVNNKKVNQEDIKIYFMQMIRLHPDMIIFINGDNRCSFKHVEGVINTLIEAGVNKVVFASEQETANNET